MGALSRFNLDYIFDNYHVEQYVETGLGSGECLNKAIEYPFKSFYSAELDADFVLDAKEKIKDFDQNIRIFHGKSTDCLREILPLLDSSPTLFWLDAHLPFADFQKITYEESLKRYGQDCFPLEEEVEIILSNRDCAKDVFLIDDRLLYEAGYACDHMNNSADFLYRELAESLGVKMDGSFLFDVFKDTHNIDGAHNDQGYYIIYPK